MEALLTIMYEKLNYDPEYPLRTVDMKSFIDLLEKQDKKMGP